MARERERLEERIRGLTALSAIGEATGRGILEILDALPFYAMLVDADHHILLASKAVSRDLGVDPEQIVGEYCPKVVHGLEEPIFSPDIEVWEMSTEDPRLTEIDDELYLTYVVTPTPCPPGAVRRRLGIPEPEKRAGARVEDFRQFTRLGIITPFAVDERNTVLFPERIEGKYAALHRPSNWIGPGYPVEQPSIWFALKALPYQKSATHVSQPRGDRVLDNIL